MKTNLLWSAAFALIVLFPGAPASQDVDMRGVVADALNAPVSGAVVSLMGMGLADTTKADGSFHVMNTNAVRNPVGRRAQSTIQLRGNAITVNSVSERTKVLIQAFDLSGRLLGSISPGPSAAGRIAVSLDRLTGPVQKIFVLRIKIDESIYFVRYVPGVCHGPAIMASPPASLPKGAAASAQAEDTLRIKKQGFLTKRMVLTALVDTLDTIHIYGVSPGFTAANYPRLDGSSLTQPLATIAACNLLGCSYGWVTSFDGSKRIVAYSPNNPQLADSINTKIAVHHGTHEAYVKIIKDSADVCLITRGPSADELLLAQSFGVTLDVQTVARDAFIMIVNEKNHVANLTVQNIRDIYTGEITNWQQVGWINATLRPYQRDSSSNSQELMMLLVMKDLTPIKAPSMILLGMMGPINMLSDDTLGLGYSIYFFKEFMSVSEKIVPVPIEGIAPDYNNIFTQQYPLTENVVLVTRKGIDPAGNAAKLCEFLLSEEGQAVVKECGYVPLFNP
jgi:ABC-type phosphate transport system substrate-binding protein